MGWQHHWMDQRIIHGVSGIVMQLRHMEGDDQLLNCAETLQPNAVMGVMMAMMTNFDYNPKMFIRKIKATFLTIFKLFSSKNLNTDSKSILYAFSSNSQVRGKLIGIQSRISITYCDFIQSPVISASIGNSCQSLKQDGTDLLIWSGIWYPLRRYPYHLSKCFQ